MNLEAEVSNRLSDDNRKIRELLWTLESYDDTYTAEGFKKALEGGLKVWIILNYTRGVWLGAGYSYKGREICHQAWTLLDSYVGRLSSGLRGSTSVKYRTLRESLRVLEYQYHEDEAQRLGASVSTLTGAGTL